MHVVRISYLIFLVGVPAAALLGPAAAQASSPLRDRGGRATVGMQTRFGRYPGLLAAALVALGAANVIGYLIGRLASWLETPVDRPFYRWTQRQVLGTVQNARGFVNHEWYRLNSTLTKMGDTQQTRVLIVVASLVLAALWWRHRPWIPPVLIIGAYLAAWLSQHVLTVAVDRGHPYRPFATAPLSLGTFPSGGCMRIVAVWGTIAVMIVYTFPRGPRWLATVLASLVGVAAWIEAYSRLYLLKHWLTDVIGGLMFGSLILFLASTFARALVKPGPSTTPITENVETALDQGS